MSTDVVRACALAALMVLWAVAAGAPGAFAATADGTAGGSIDRGELAAVDGGGLAADEDEADATLEDGELYYVGVTLFRDEGVDPDEDLELLDDDGNLENLVFADEDGEVLIRTGGDDLGEGEYTLVDSDGNEIASFRLLDQSLSVSLDPGSVDTSGSDTTTTVSVESNRRSYDLDVTASRDGGGTIGPSRLQDIFGTGTVVDADDDGRDDALRLSGSQRFSVDADFEDANPGIYDFTFRVPDTGETVTESLTVGEEETGDATFVGGRNSITDHRGDVPEVSVSLEDTDRVTFEIGGSGVNYVIETTVRDSDGDGQVTLRWNTDRAGRRPAGEVVSAPEGDSVQSATRTRGGIGDTRRIAAARYPLRVRVGGEITDSGQINLLEPDERSRSVTSFTASGDLDPGEVVDEASESGSVSFGDYVVLRLRAAGIHGVVQSRNDLVAERDGISVSIRETSSSAGNSPRTRIDLETLRFEQRAAQDDIYLFATSGRGSFEAGDTYRVTFEIEADDNPYVDEDVERETTFSVVARDVAVDTGMDDTLRVQRTTEPVCGTSTLPAGEEVTLEHLDSDADRIRGSATATVDDDGRFCADIDFSNREVGEEFRIAALFDGEEIASADGVVVERGSVSLADQRPGERRLVDVESARLPDGGYVVIERADDGTVLGWSQPLPPGVHEDLTVTLENRIESRTDVRAVIHRNNGQGTFDRSGEVDVPYRFDGTAIADGATLRVEGDDTTTTADTTTTETTTTADTTTTETTTTADTTTTETTTTDGEDDGGGSPLPVPGFGIGAAVVAILAALLLRRRLR